MTVETAIVAIFLGILASAGVTLASAWASRRFGLPGIARQAEDEQAKTIAALVTRLDLAEQAATIAKATATETERKRRACEADIRLLRRDLRDTQHELLELYRETGTRPPKRLSDREPND